MDGDIGGFFFELFQDAIDDVMGHEWFAVVFSDVGVDGETGFAAEITVELS